MPGQPPYIAAFDLDKTILSVNSSRLVVKKSREMGMMSNRDFRMAIYYSVVYKFDLKDANEIVLSMMQWLKGLSESEVKDMADKFVVPEIKKLVRPEIEKELEYHRKRNAHIVMLSSALPYLCDPMAEYLDMNDVVCSNLEISDGVFTGKSIRPLVFGPEKATRMTEYCRENGYSLDDAWYYGDAFTDRFVMKAVGHPVAVKPEIKLGWMARRRGWKVI